MIEPQNLRTSSIAVAGFISAVLTFVVIVVVQVLYLQMETSVAEESSQQNRASQASQLIAEQEGRLASYAWIDREQGIVQIPVDRAMAIIVAEELTERSEVRDASRSD